MRSRIARACARVSVFVAGLAAIAMSAGTANAQPAGAPVGSNPLESMSTLGLTAVGLGVVGMVAGALRRKKAPVQPENQRKLP